MNKGTKLKNSSRVVKSSRNLTAKYSYATDSHTPQNKKTRQEVRRSNIEKFKSIPTITCRDVQFIQIPTDNPIYQSYTTHNVELTQGQETEPNLLYSMSDRNHSASKASLRSKAQRSSKQTMVTSKNKSNYTIQSQRTPSGLEKILERTKLVLDSYREK